jgi:hypothetical protein
VVRGSPCFWRCSVADNLVHPVFGLCGMSTVGGAVFYCRDGYKAKVAGLVAYKGLDIAVAPCISKAFRHISGNGCSCVPMIRCRTEELKPIGFSYLVKVLSVGFVFGC